MAKLSKVLLLSFSFFVSFSCKREEPGARTTSAAAVPVSVGVVVQKDVPIEVSAIGSVEPISTVEIVPQVTGQVMDVHFKEGDFVKAGDRLFTIDTRPYSSSLAAAQAQLAKNRALAEQAKQEAERYANLTREGVATKQELLRAQAEAASQEATVKADEAALKSARLNVQFTTIRSPIDGRTGSLLIHAGNVVQAGDARPLVVVRTLSPTYVRFAVPQQYLPQIREGMAKGLRVRATARGDGGKSIYGTLTFMENTVDPATGTLSLKALFENREQMLWPGAFVDTVLELGVEKQAIVAPDAAIQQGQEGAYAFVIGAENKALLRRVQLKRLHGTEAIISEGLSAGDQVVTDGQVRLRHGSKVSIKPAITAATAEEEPSAAPAGTGGQAL